MLAFPDSLACATLGGRAEQRLGGSKQKNEQGESKCKPSQTSPLEGEGKIRKKSIQGRGTSECQQREVGHGKRIKQAEASSKGASFQKPSALLQAWESRIQQHCSVVSEIGSGSPVAPYVTQVAANSQSSCQPGFCMENKAKQSQEHSIMYLTGLNGQERENELACWRC